MEGKNYLKVNFASIPYENTAETVIGNDVWVGASCLIKAGVTIGDGAVIGMGSVVTKDIGPYEIWAGVPAKRIKCRFAEDTVRKLLELQWWNWSQNTIKKKANLFDQPDRLMAGKPCDR